MMIDASKCDPDAIRSKKVIAAFVKDLVNAIDMVAFGKPRIVMFGTGNKKGYTLVQLIETSDITAHFVEETNDVYLDVFYCKTFDPKVAIRVFDAYFSSGRKKVHYVKRQA
jgi:S-adenosylmethionine/arginine decarboxylase-like enzyme